MTTISPPPRPRWRRWAQTAAAGNLLWPLALMIWWPVLVGAPPPSPTSDPSSSTPVPGGKPDPATWIEPAVPATQVRPPLPPPGAGDPAPWSPAPPPAPEPSTVATDDTQPPTRSKPARTPTPSEPAPSPSLPETAPEPTPEPTEEG